jgi:arylsulfatase A-like enzyme
MRWILLLMFGCSQPVVEPEVVATTPPPPNVLIISLDTVSAEHLSVYGGRAKTPNLEAMAQAGTTFDAAISHFPETALSHWSMLTGVLPAVHGNVPAHGDSRYTGPTLAERLKAVGYSTAAFIGGETLTKRSTGLDRGFAVYDDRYPWDRKDLKRPGRQVVAAAGAWMQEQGRDDKPFFAFVHLFDAHFPYTPAPPWDEAYATGYTGTLTGSDADLRAFRDGDKTPTQAELAHVEALYDGEISELDEIIAPLLNSETAGQTIVVVTSDHGESFGHDYWFNHRGGLWDEITRVPLVIRGPGVPSGERRTGVVGLVDLTPTLLDLLGLEPLDHVHGVALGPTLSGAESGDRVAFSITDPWRPDPQFAARTSAHKLIAPSENGMPTAADQQRFDLRTDPAELNAAAVLPERFESLGGVYQAKLQAVMARSQGVKPQTREPDAGEIERLKALGYVGEPEAEQAPH